eukprot:COSAG01_NODE_1416_length_10373_cov_4.944984_6_plen_51_part_00
MAGRRWWGCKFVGRAVQPCGLTWAVVVSALVLLLMVWGFGESGGYRASLD